MIPLLLWACASEPDAPPPPPPEPVKPDVRPAWNPQDCVEPLTLEWTPLEAGKGGLRHARALVNDLNGDGKFETFIVRQDAGTGFATVKLTLELSEADPIVIDHTWSYNEMVHTIPVPDALKGDDKADWRAPFEQELLRIKCPEADPALAWLSDPTPTWHQGSVILPSLYGTYDAEKESWTVVSAHTHTMDPPPVGKWPVTDETKETLSVQRTQHGAVLYDSELDAHRWLYVSKTGTGKLRFPTVVLTGFEGEGVIIARNGPPGTPTPSLHVDLQTGKVVEEGSKSEPDPG